MKIENFEVLPAHVTFSNGIVRVFLERGECTARFFKSDSLVGEIDLGRLEWGAFPNNQILDDWKIEFVDKTTKEIISIHYHLVHSSNILFVPKPNSTLTEMVNSVIEDCKNAQLKGGITWVFFVGCYRFRGLLESENIKVFELGKDKEIEFPFIFEKQY